MKNENKNKVTVEIYGMQYRLAGESEAMHMKKVAQIVDARMQKIQKAYPRLDAQRIAILSAVNIADDLISTQDQIGKQQHLQDDAVAKVRRESNEQLENIRTQVATAQAEAKQARQQQQAAREQADKAQKLADNADQLLMREREYALELRNEVEQLREEKAKRQEDGRLLLEQVQRAQDQSAKTQKDNERLFEELREAQEEREVILRDYERLRREHDEWMNMIDRNTTA